MAKKFSRDAFVKPEAQYIRIGVDYFKVLHKSDRYNIARKELKRWNKEEIKLDHGQHILREILKYDDFIMAPNNKDYRSEVDNYYNLYSEFTHKPEEGEWKWTKILLEHVFGEQYEIGIRYMQVLYQLPQQALPVLVLVSKERQTGKSTFIDWLMTIFGANMVVISPHDLSREFNGSYSKANIIAIEETLIEKNSIVEKVKAISTQKYINANLKNVNDFMIPFYGKIIMASNNERKFMKIESEEIRFFVRKLTKPVYENHKILTDMIDEIPAFLHYLDTLPPIDCSKSRMVFTAEELDNDCLSRVKNESHTWLYKEMFAIFEDLFNNQVARPEVFATPKEIKDRYFINNSQVSSSFIKDVLIEEFKFAKSEKNVSYKSLDSEFFKTGQPFTIPKNTFLSEKMTENDQKTPKNDENDDFFEKCQVYDNQQKDKNGLPF